MKSAPLPAVPPTSLPPGWGSMSLLSSLNVLNHLPMAILVADEDFRVMYANARFRAWFGLPAHEPGVLGWEAARLVRYLAPFFKDPAQFLADSRPAIDRVGTVPPGRYQLVDGRTLEREVELCEDGRRIVTFRDVSEAARLQAELEDAARIPDHNPNPIVRYRADGEILYRNRAAIYNAEHLPAEAVADFRTRLHELGRLALHHDEARTVEMPLGELYFEVQAVPFSQEGYCNFYLTDRTARRQGEAALEEQRAFYENVLDHLPADVAVLDPTTLRYRYANRHALRNPALRTWLIGHDDRELYEYRHQPPDEAVRRQRLWRRALDQRRAIQWDEVVETRAGTEWRHIRRFAQPVFDESGRPTMLIGYGVDITEIREAQRIHEQAEKRYHDLMHYSHALICTHDLDGTVLTVNPAITDLLRMPESQIVGRSILLAVPAGDRPAALAYLAQFGAGPGTNTSGIMRLKPPGVHETRYLLYHNVRVDEPGEVPYVIGYAQDVTERIRADRATRKAKEAAEDAAQARASFLASMSHEIRTPLNGILGLAGQLVKTGLTPEQRHFVDLIGSSGRTLLALLNNVLDLSKISSHHMELLPEPFDLMVTLRSVVETLELRAEEKNIALELIPLPLPTLGVLSDPHRLVQILTNLVANALRFTERGHVRLEARLRASTPETVTVTLLVRDSGIGIAPEMQERVFEEFTQANSDISRRYGGTGLGLAISTQLVTLFGSHLLLTSEPGQGTTFGFTLRLPRAELPVPDEAADDGDDEVPASSTLLRGRRVLLVEDHSINRMLARLLLVSHGAEVVEATNGAVAVEVVQQQAPFDVILMDIQMPVMDGVAATAAIRALPDPARAQVPILALTANAFRDDVLRYLAAGLNDCITKPFEEADLLRVLARLLDMPVAPPAAAPAGPAPDVFPATALRLGHGRLDFVRQLTADFVADTPALLAELGAPTTAAARVAALAHQLKPSGQLFDADELFETLRTLEMLPADHPSWPDVRHYAVQLLADLLAELTQWLAAPAPPTRSGEPESL